MWRRRESLLLGLVSMWLYGFVLCVCCSVEELLDLVTRWALRGGSADPFPVGANVGRSFAGECCEAAGALFCRNVLYRRDLKGCFHVCGLEQH